MKVCVIGLGYVGLPLAVRFSKVLEVCAFDINQERIDELNRGKDSTGEVSSEDLKSSNILFSSNPEVIKTAQFIIIAVPTPITTDKAPDLRPLLSASRTVGKNLQKGSIVVYESTVYPGCTEEDCVPILEAESALVCGTDFKVGYSPERMNPGDKEHTVDKIVKVVSGMDEESLATIAKTYEKIVSAGVFRASSIKVAEAAKVIENTQRDLNIALMNELHLIFEKLGISTNDVLEAASTKWNFARFYPGLVGGHCIGVDPYYLAHKAQKHNHNPELILAGRRINEFMPWYLAQKVVKELIKQDKKIKGSRVAVLGVTFKPNVPDTRNSKAKEVIDELLSYGINVVACDPLVGETTVQKEFGVLNIPLEKLTADLYVMVSPHKQFDSLNLAPLVRL